MKKKTNREKFLAAIPEEKAPPLLDIHAHMAELEAGREWLELSAAVALRVHHLLKRGEGRSQKWLAEQMDVSEQQVSKILRGQENLTLSTIAKLHKALRELVVQVPEESMPVKPRKMTEEAVKEPQKASVIHGQRNAMVFAGGVTVVQRRVLRAQRGTPRTKVVFA